MDLPKSKDMAVRKYFNPTPGQFPIMGVGKRLGYTFIDFDTIELFVDCGINIVENIMWNDPPAPPDNYSSVSNYTSNILKNTAITLEMCGGWGIWQMVRIRVEKESGEIDLNKWKEYWIDVVETFKDFPQVGAWMLDDEPLVESFEAIGEVSEAIRKNDSTRSVYVNLLPWYKFKDDSIYSAYLSEADRLINPQIWSVDFYPFKKSGSSIKLDDEFFKSLIQFKELADRDGVPFWWTVKTCLDSSKDLGIVSVVSSACIDFQAVCALAFGCQGLVVWRMTGDNFLDKKDKKNTYAPIVYKEKEGASEWDNEQILTPVYDAVKEVFSKIRRLDKIFLDNKILNIECPNPDALEAFKCLGSLPDKGSSIEYAYKLNPDGTVSNEKAELLISRFETNNETFILVINLKWSIYQSFQLVFKPLVREIDTTKDFSFSKMPFKGNLMHTFKGTYAPSEWRIYRVNK